MRSKGNRIKLPTVLLGMLVLFVALAAMLIFRDTTKYDMSIKEGSEFDPNYIVTFSSDAPINAIGPQRSPQKEAQIRRLNGQMRQSLGLRSVE